MTYTNVHATLRSTETDETAGAQAGAPVRLGEPAMPSSTLRPAQSPPSGSYSERVCQMIREALNDGVPTQASVAQAMSLGERTLRRRLQREGTHFRGLLDLARRQIACESLAGSRVSLTQLAVTLGFAHQSAFTRAFRRWFGMTPSAWRAASRAYEPAYQVPGSATPSGISLRLRSIG